MASKRCWARAAAISRSMRARWKNSAARKSELEFDETRAAKLRRKEIGRTRKATAAMQFPAGSDIRVRKDFAHAHPFGGFFGKVESVRGKGVVTAMIELFGRLTPVEFQADEIERVR